MLPLVPGGWLVPPKPKQKIVLVPMPEPETLPSPKPKAPVVLKPKTKISKPKTKSSKPRKPRRHRTIQITDDVDDETEAASGDPVTPDDQWVSKLTCVDLGPFRPGVLAVEAAAAAAANPTNIPAMVSGGLGEPDPRNKRTRSRPVPNMHHTTAGSGPTTTGVYSSGHSIPPTPTPTACSAPRSVRASCWHQGEGGSR